MKKNIIPIILGLLIIPFAIGFYNLVFYKTFAPKQENIRREVFEETRSYNQAKVQELAKLKYEYEIAPQDEKIALSSLIRHKFADYENDRMSSELKLFLKEIRGY